MESTEAPSKRRRFETSLLGASGADEDLTEESTEGHVVVHLNADLLHKIKQEPVDSGETPELTCVALQKDSNDNTFRETLLNESRPDPNNDDRGCASPTIPMMNETSAENESGIINERISPCIGASPATARTRSRRSVRKRFSVQRSSPEIGVSSSSSYHNLSVSKQSKNALSIRSGHRKRTNTVNQPAFSNQLVSEGSLGSTDACDITSDASDLFKRRFRKMLKDLVAKRMLKLQHSAVYSGTVSALRRKVAILERRNMQLEDKAERLQTSMMNLHNEKEKRATKTVSRGTQVSMGMILSRAWSACQGIDKASSFEERGSLAIPGDGPVIVKVCGKQHATGPVNRIATVRPQQFIPSSANISLAQNVPPQAAQMPTLPRPRLESMNLPIPKDNTANISTIISQILPPVHQTDLSSSRPAMTQTQSGNARTASMSSTVGRRRRPPGGCFCCPPDPNQRHTVGNQNPVRSGDDLRLHPGSNHEATRGQFSTTNQVSPSICTSGARTQGSLSELQPTVPLPYPQQFFPVTQASNKSSCSVPTGELANQIRSSGPNHHQRQNVLPGHVNSPRAGMLCSQALPTIPESIRSAHGKQLTGGPPLKISSRAVPQQSEIQISSSVVQNPLNQEWSRSHPRESIRAPDQPLSPLSGVDLHPASHPAQRQMFHFTKEQIACNSDGGYATTIRQCSSQQHPQQQQQLPTQPYIQIHQQQVPLQQHPPRQELEQQQQRQQQQRQQPQQQQQLQKQLHQHPRRAGYVPPTPILPKPDSRAHQYWQRNPQFTASGASHCGTSVPQQLPAALNTASSSNFCLNQRPPIQTQFLRPYTPHNVRNGAYLQQPIQPSVQQNQSSVQTSSAPVSQLSVNMVQISKSVSLQRERTGTGSIQHSQTPYSPNTRACLHPNTTHSSLPRQRPNDSERNSARAAKSITPTIYNAANEHLLERRTSFTTPNIATTSIIPTNSFRSAPQSPSMPSEPLLNSPTKTLLPATRTPEPRNTPLRNAQGSELKGNEAITDEASCPTTALSSKTGFTTRLLPVQNFVGMKLSDDFKNVNNSETDGNNKLLDSQRDVAGQIVNFSDITEKGDKEGPQLQKDKASYLKPILGVEQSSNGIVLSWDLTSREYESKVIKYELFVTTASSESTGWQSLGVVDALALPMACTMTQFLPGASYYFTVRAITDVGDCGSEMFSHPCSITVLESNQNSSSVSPV